MTANDARTYKGYRLFAVDGTSFFVGKLKDEALREYFGESTTVEGKAMCRISSVVDIPNNCIVNAKVSGYQTGERVLAIRQVEELGCVPNALFLFDRGYWSPELLAAILAGGHKFVIRLQSNHVKSVAKDKKLRALGLRLGSFRLRGGDAETLLTNLPVEEVSDEELFDLYAMRWGIECKYLELKARLEIDNLSEQSLNSILQDIYSTLYMANLTAFLCFEADEIIQERTAGKDNKYEQKANSSCCIYLLRDRFVSICLLRNPLQRTAQMSRLVKDITSNVTYVGKSKHRPRDMRKLKEARLRKPQKSSV